MARAKAFLILIVASTLCAGCEVVGFGATRTIGNSDDVGTSISITTRPRTTQSAPTPAPEPEVATPG